MEISKKLKERFCKDMNLVIKLFDEPYFENRLKLYDKQFQTIKKYEMFKELLSKFKTEQSYFEAYNNLKDSIIDYLKASPEMVAFQNEDMNQYKIMNSSFTANDVYRTNFDGKKFLSDSRRSTKSI